MHRFFACVWYFTITLKIDHVNPSRNDIVVVQFKQVRIDNSTTNRSTWYLKHIIIYLFHSFYTPPRKPKFLLDNKL